MDPTCRRLRFYCAGRRQQGVAAWGHPDPARPCLNVGGGWRRRARAHALYSAHNVEHGLRASSALASNRRWQRRWPPPKPALALRRTRVELPLRPKAGPMRFGLGHVLSIWLGRRPFLRERCCFRAEQLRAALRDLVRGLFGLAQCSLAPSTCAQRSWLCRVRPV